MLHLFEACNTILVRALHMIRRMVLASSIHIVFADTITIMYVHGNGAKEAQEEVEW